MNSTLTVKTPCLISQLARLLQYGTKLLSCFSVIVWLFLSLTFFSSLSSPAFLARKIGGFGVALKNPSQWKSVTWLEEVGVPTGSGTFLQICPPFTFSEFLQKIGQRW